MTKTVKDDLADVIADSLNKMNKDGDQIAYILHNEDTPTDLTEFISTGASMLDLAVANKPHGGIACGRITELQGLEGSGKSLLTAHMIADTQRRGGVAVLIDTENALNEDFFASVGVDRSKLVYAQIFTVEEIFEAITHIIETVRKKEKDRLTLIIVDSLAAASTKSEMEADYDREGYATGKALIINKALRKITGLIGKEKIALVFTQQLRHRMDAMPFGDKWTTPGGKALAYHASTRIRLDMIGKIKNKTDDVVGVKVKASVIKNRLGPPFRKTEFEIYFDRGIDDASSWLETMKDKDLIKQGGAWYSIKDDSNKKIEFQAKDWAEILNKEPERKEFWYKQICDAVIMGYRSNDISITDGTAKLVKEVSEDE